MNNELTYYYVDFFRHIPKFYSPQRVFHDLVRNDDNWFILFPSKMIHPGETDDHCFVQLNQDISILENIRTRFTQSQLSTRYTAGPSLRTFLDVTLNSLQHKISLLRLPPVNDTFGFLFANGVRSVASTSSRPQSSEFSPTFTQL
uniref:Uncharacterized protein n=2 Tax=Caenorhabditis japonica TaxID=281687 RepID=A0A8R1IVV6_CAEJA